MLEKKLYEFWFKVGIIKVTHELIPIIKRVEVDKYVCNQDILIQLF